MSVRQNGCQDNDGCGRWFDSLGDRRARAWGWAPSKISSRSSPRASARCATRFNEGFRWPLSSREIWLALIPSSSASEACVNRKAFRRPFNNCAMLLPRSAHLPTAPGCSVLRNTVTGPPRLNSLATCFRAGRKARSCASPLRQSRLRCRIQPRTTITSSNHSGISLLLAARHLPGYWSAPLMPRVAHFAQNDCWRHGRTARISLAIPPLPRRRFAQNGYFGQ